MTEPRRLFQLSESDRDFLDRSYPGWEAIVEGQVQWLLLTPLAVPKGYNHRTASVALRITPTYPDTEIDMAYFSPELARFDGKTIGGLSELNLDGKVWQQWSRHRGGSWRSGVDDIETHLLYVRSFLELELKK